MENDRIPICVKEWRCHMRNIYKSRTVAAVLAVALFLSGCSVETDAPTTRREVEFLAGMTTANDLSTVDFDVMAETDRLRLEVNLDTAVFRVVVKEDGRVWSSGDDTQRAQFTIAYSSPSGSIGYMDSYTDSVAKGQYRIEPVENGFRVQYSLGTIEDDLLGPVLMSLAHYEAVYENSSSKNRQILSNVYYLVDLDTMEKEKKKELLSTYPALENGPLYVLRNTSMSGSVKKLLDAALSAGGYTAEQQSEDDALCELGEDESVPRFNVTVYYTLEGDALRVRIPESEIFQYENIPMETLNLLPYFGQPAQGDSGYYLLPDGSGSIMNFFNGKGDMQDYTAPIYGTNTDLLMDERVSREEQAILPLFGCRNGEDGFLTVIEAGESMATVTATPGSDRKRPAAYVRFRITEKAQMDAIVVNSNLLNNSYYTLHEKKRYTGDLQVSYYFLTDGESDYSGMAARYRALLPETDGASAGTPLVAEMVGVVDVTQNIAGILTRRDQLLTSLEDVRTIAAELQTGGAENLSIRLVGYLNGGYRQTFLKSVKVGEKIGKAETLRSLTRTLTGDDVAVYLDADIQTAYKGGWWSGPNLSRDVTRYLSKEVGVLYPYDPSSFQPDTAARARYILKSSAIQRCTDALKEFVTDWDIPGLSLRDVGRSLHADYSQEDGMSREAAAQALYDMVASLGKDASLLLSGGQARFALLADVLIDMPMSSAGHDITDYSVPFAAMVYSGKLSYTGACANLEYDNDSDYLRLIENGAGLYVRLCAGDGTELQNTDFTSWFSIGYDVQKDDVLTRYAWLSEALDGCAGERLIRHRRLNDQVACSTFESGWSVYVNYGDASFELDDGTQIEPYGYYRVKEAAV